MSLLPSVFVGMMFLGLFFVLTGALGVVRFKDIYLRMHAASKAGTLGFALFIMGAALLSNYNEPNPQVIVKAVLAIIFQFLTAPVAAHMVARVALQKGVKPLTSPDEPAQKF
ncbi:Na+/H+ antiporter subunit G [bacterium]|nr:Na+/H+ antiporter subunit G [bacterium]